MDKTERKKKLKRYERLGAVKFQKVVFAVENLKFKVLKKCFPNFITYFDKYMDWKQRKLLKTVKTEEEKKNIKDNVKLAKMAMRKEWHEEKNRNYHIDMKRPGEITKFLQWNKDVHKRGLLKDAVLIPFCIAGTIAQIPGAAILLGWEVLNAAINFECINIQNYNLCRLEEIQPVLIKRQERRMEKDIEEFGGAAEVIHKTIEESESLPTFDQIIENIQTKEQLEQMRAMFHRAQEERQVQKKIGGI